jgi:hypothetical protein
MQAALSLGNLRGSATFEKMTMASVAKWGLASRSCAASEDIRAPAVWVAGGVGMAGDLVVSLLVLLRHPLLLAELLFVAGVLLSSVGRSLGLPHMFWSEKPRVQFAAGLGCNLLAALVLFIAYLADTPSRIPALRFLFITAVTWSAVFLVGFVAQVRAHAESPQPAGPASAKVTHARMSSVRRTPGIRMMVSATLGSMASPTPSPWPFLGGALAGVALAVVIGGGGLWLVTALPQPTDWVARIAHFLRPVSGVDGVSGPHLHALAVLIAGIVLIAFVLLRPIASPALGICMLLALVAEIDGAVAFWLHSPGLGALVALGLLWWAGGQVYKVRLADVAAAYASSARVPYPPRSIGAPASLRADCLAEPTHGASGGPDLDIPGYDSKCKRPLLLVCTSGGGIRAAAWTAAILGQLDDDPNFRPHTWIVSGASGGMVGAAVWAAASVSPQRANWRNLMSAVGADSLAPVVRRLVFSDVPGTLSPRVDADDRGTALQARWRENVATLGELGTRLSDLSGAEQKGKIPSLVFSPMVVEDGRRLLVSNLALAWTVANQVNWLEEGGAIVPAVASVTAYHARDILGAAFDGITLATAARLSASFPYVSPAAQLPTEPARRVVDAGYYDNYGVELACSWLQRCFEHNRKWIAERVSGILVIQIRDGESELSPEPADLATGPGAAGATRSPRWRPVAPTAESPGRLARSLRGLTSPLEGVLAARQSAMLFRNDAQLHAVRGLYATKFDPGFVATTIFELKADVSLSWALSSAELDLIGDQASSAGIRGKVGNVKAWSAARLQRL